MNVTYVLLAVFAVFLISIGYWTSKVKDAKSEHFLIGNRGVGGVLVGIGIVMSWVDAFLFGFYGGWAFDNGWGVMAPVFGVLFGFLYLSYFAPRIHSIGAKGGMYMLSDIIRESFSRRSAAIAGVSVFVYFFLWKMIQFVIGGQVISAVLGISPLTTALIMGVTVLALLLLGGFRAQVYTDLVQFVLFVVVAGVMIGLYIPSIHEWIAPLNSFFFPSYAIWFALFISSLAGTISAPDVWQRIYSSKSGKDARWSMYLACVFLVTIEVVAGFFGMIVKHYSFALSSSDVSPAIFTHVVPATMLPIACVMFFAVIMSTIATTLFGAGMGITNDLLNSLGFVKREKIEKVQKIVMTVLLFVSIYITTLPVDILSVAFYTLSSCLVTLPIIMIILHKIKVHESSVFWSMVFSMISFFVGVKFGYLDGAWVLLPVYVSLVVLIVMEGFSKVFKKSVSR